MANCVWGVEWIREIEIYARDPFVLAWLVMLLHSSSAGPSTCFLMEGPILVFHRRDVTVSFLVPPLRLPPERYEP